MWLDYRVNPSGFMLQFRQTNGVYLRFVFGGPGAGQLGFGIIGDK